MAKAGEAALSHVLSTYFTELRSLHGLVLCRADMLSSCLRVDDALSH